MTVTDGCGATSTATEQMTVQNHDAVSCVGPIASGSTTAGGTSLTLPVCQATGNGDEPTISLLLTGTACGTIAASETTGKNTYTLVTTIANGTSNCTAVLHMSKSNPLIAN